MVSGQVLPSVSQGKLPPPVRVRVWAKGRVSFRIGGNETIALEKNCPLVRVRGWIRVSFGVGRQFSQNS